MIIPSWLFRLKVLNPMSRATLGTIKGIGIAISKKWWINFSGGYHHATLNFGGGFWVYPDISLAIKYGFDVYGLENIWVIDVDVHQGNGY